MKTVSPAKILITITLVLVTLVFLSKTSYANDAVYETKWLSSKGLENELSKMKGNRLYPCLVEGKINGIEIAYKGSFCPYPFEMVFFQARWGMSSLWYTANKKHFEEEGFIEEFHNTYFDLSGNEVHQATWLLFNAEN